MIMLYSKYKKIFKFTFSDYESLIDEAFKYIQFNFTTLKFNTSTALSSKMCVETNAFGQAYKFELEQNTKTTIFFPGFPQGSIHFLTTIYNYFLNTFSFVSCYKVNQMKSQLYFLLLIISNKLHAFITIMQFKLISSQLLPMFFLLHKTIVEVLSICFSPLQSREVGVFLTVRRLTPL